MMTMKKEEHKTASEVMKAIGVLADYLGMEEQEVVSNVCFLDKEKYAKIVAANTIRNQFLDMDFDSRARVYGYEPVTHKNGTKSITTVL